MENLPFEISIIEPHADSEDLALLYRDLRNDMEDHTDVEVAVTPAELQPGEKGVGEVVKFLLNSKVVQAVFDVIRTKIDQQPKVEVEFTHPEKGTSFKFSAQNMSSEEIEKTLAAFKNFIE